MLLPNGSSEKQRACQKVQFGCGYDSNLHLFTSLLERIDIR